MLSGLNGLKNGTAEGCRAPLENAHKELRAIRFDHFISPQNVTAHEEQHGKLPDKLRRDETIDNALQRFKASIESALECYSRQAHEEIDDDLPSAPKQENPQTSKVADFVAESEKANAAINASILDAQAVVNREMAEGDRYLLTLHDALNLNSYSRGIYQLPKLDKDWLKPLQQQLLALPDRLQNSAKALTQKAGAMIESTADFVMPSAQTIDEFKANPAQSVVRAVKNVGVAMQNIAPAVPPHVDPEIQKAAEEEAARLLKKNEAVPEEVAVNVRAINLGFSEFNSPTLLNVFPHLQELLLWLTQISDFSVLEGMTQLQTLRLDNTQISDFSVLEGMTQLQTLDLNNTQISDISLLEGMTQLQTLDLNNTQISDFSVLEGMTQLQSLYLNNTKISDISVLEGMTQLQILRLNNTQISDISVLEGMKQLQFLNLDNIEISDWSPVDHVENVSGRPNDWVRKGKE